jgi:sugar lactone lactonase YvrE
VTRRGMMMLAAAFLLTAVTGWLAMACGPRTETPEGDTPADTTGSDTLAGAPAGEASLGDPILVVESLPTPESAAVGPDGRYYVSLIGEFGKDGDGAVVILDPETGAQTPYASGLFDPTGLVFKDDTLYAADRDGVLRIAPGGAVSMLASADAFPRKPMFLNDVVLDGEGNLLVSDTGDLTSPAGGAIFRVTPAGEVSLVAHSDSVPEVTKVNGLARGPDGMIYALGFGSGELHASQGEGAWRKVGEGYGKGDGLAFDSAGRLWVTDHEGGYVLLAEPAAPQAAPRRVAQGLEGAADLTVDEARGRLVVPELRGNRIKVFELP